MMLYCEGRFLWCALNNIHKYAVLEGGRDRPVAMCRTMEDAEERAAELIKRKRAFIARLRKALKEDERHKEQRPKHWMQRDIRDDYESDAEIDAAIRRVERSIASIRIVPIEEREEEE